MIQLNQLKNIAKNSLVEAMSPIEIYGLKNTLGLSLSLIELAKEFPQEKQLIMLPSDVVIEEIELCFRLFNFDSFISWPGNDVSPYSSIFSSYRSIGKRSGFLSSLVGSQYQIFLCNINNASEKLSPPEFFSENSFILKKACELPRNFISNLQELGYRNVDTVEDPLTFSFRGELIDLYLPNYSQPIRIELFDTDIESIRFFDPDNQRSSKLVDEVLVPPASEVLYSQADLEKVLYRWKKSCEANDISWKSKKDFVQKITKRQYFDGIHYLYPYFQERTVDLFSFFKSVTTWVYDAHESFRQWENYYQDKKNGYRDTDPTELAPAVIDLYEGPSLFDKSECNKIFLNPFRINDEFGVSDQRSFEFKMLLNSKDSYSIEESKRSHSDNICERVKAWRMQGYKVLAFFTSSTQLERAKLQIVDHKIKYHQLKSVGELKGTLARQEKNLDLISICIGNISEGAVFTDDLTVVLNEADFFGKKQVKRSQKSKGNLEARSGQLSFSDLSKGDLLVHIQHGVGEYKGLSTMNNDGAETEFILLEYRGKDKLYIPVYKIGLLQKYSGTHSIDRLGSKSWENSKIKVKSALKEIADELIRLYAKREKVTRQSFSIPGLNYQKFEDEFPYNETEDQLRAISEINSDFLKDKPMDRLVCGDVGFGKTEVAMRAAFRALEENKQVAVLVPTTVLAFQHYENFKKRFAKWPFEIRSVGRFSTKKDIKDSLDLLSIGKLDLLIGTHRLLSSDIKFQKLGLLIIDEEHRFGVTHKEKLKQLKANLDCLSLSATPIPRTLNMALMGVRDLSIINTAPQDRLPTKTYINRFNKSSIRKAIQAEMQRDGQVYFIHNRVQSIYAKAQELREIVPEANVQVAHGQMKDGELEKVMLAFFENKFDVLLCTTIVENGVDNQNANTMLIDNSHQFGLSQLYQLRGRVGRSKERAYCYLLIPQNTRLDPDAQERLKVIQENTALGSGFKIANHDLELRGAGSFLGAEQSGHANTVGYDLYLELLEQTIKEVKGEKVVEEIEPEINLRIPALIPDRFIPDIRVRLSYYKNLSEIRSEDDLESIEAELVDQFGKLPEEVINLMGIMLIRKFCKDLGIREIAAGQVNVAFSFSANTNVAVNCLIDWAIKDPSKYRLTPDNRLIIRMNDISWPNVLEATKMLAKLK